MELNMFTVGDDCARLMAKRDKELIRRMAAYLGVSYTALVIRLRGLDMLEYHDISEYIYISNELQLGGVQ